MEESTYRRSNLGTRRGDEEELSTFVLRYVEFRGRNFLKEGKVVTLALINHIFNTLECLREIM